jgi:hypothetical protein
MSLGSAAIAIPAVLVLTVAAGSAPQPKAAAATAATIPAATAATAATTAWIDGHFAASTAGIVRQSDIVLGRANYSDTQYMPLGNGSLGVAEWAANGFTAQLNRTDTMPGRLSPGQVTIPGLSALATAPDFRGTLDIYDGVLTESGGGETMTAWVPANSDELIVDVTGANPDSTQTASVNLWAGRTPSATASGAVAALSDTWIDDPASNPATGSGKTFGSLAAITAGGRDVTASVTDSETVTVSFKPNADGSYRVVVAAPHWAGGDAMATARRLLGGTPAVPQARLLAPQEAWWHRYWANTGLLEMSSSDGTAQYLQSVRTIYLYTEAASMRGEYPGSQAGVADLFNFSDDHQDWYPAGTWFWNLRTQIATNIATGNYALNIPIFRLYLDNLPELQAWTKAQMGGLPGICIPETMRFNGNGYQNDSDPDSDASCRQASNPTWNGLTVTTGTELALWIWQQYENTRDLRFLRTYYPLIQQSAIFLLAYQTLGSDGYLHAIANSHEDQWGVQDPTTDLAADQALFPVVAQAAGILHTDSALAARARAAESEIEPYARTDEATHTQLLGPSADSSGTDVIGDSYQPTATIHNDENDGLEPVWPYGVIGDDTVTSSGDNLTALAGRTYEYRPTVNAPDWNFDAIDAARLDMSGQVESDLIASTEKYQAYVSGMGSWQGGTGDEPYIEQPAGVATALDEAAVTDYDGTLRFAPAWPSGWNVSGTISIQNQAKADVQVENGTLVTAAIEAGNGGPMTIRNPWPGQRAQVVDGRTGQVVVPPTAAAVFTLTTQRGGTYLVEQPNQPTTALPFAAVTGTPATAAQHLGDVSIGLDPAVMIPQNHRPL